MKALVAAMFLLLFVEAQCDVMDVLRFPGQAVGGAADMARAYMDLREANFKNSDKYFHARGNYDAAQRGAGGRWAAEVISNAREWGSRNPADSAADQAANRHGRDGGDPNVYRPAGLPSKY